MIAIFPGSFDPVTNGHINIINRASKIFDSLIVAVLDNDEKKPLFSKDERAQMLRDCLINLKNVTVETYNGLTVDFAKKCNSKVLIRGIRNNEDISYEKKLYDAYKNSDPDLEIVYLFSEPKFENISSSSVKYDFSNNKDISDLVPSNVLKQLRDKKISDFSEI